MEHCMQGGGRMPLDQSGNELELVCQHVRKTGPVLVPVMVPYKSYQRRCGQRGTGDRALRVRQR